MDASQTNPEASRQFAFRRLLFILPMTCLCLGWDLYSKTSIFSQLGFPGRQGKVYHWLGKLSTFSLYTSFNEGALWGVGQGFAWLFAALSVVAIFVILYVLLRTLAGRSNWLTFALCLVLGGTLGNLYDRLGLHGCINPETGRPYLAVRDFLLFTFGTYSWPVFNYADVFLVTGTGMWVAYSFWSERQAAKQTVVATESAQPA